MIRNWMIYIVTLLVLMIFSIMYIKESGVVVLIMAATVPLLCSFLTHLFTGKRITATFQDEVLTVLRGETANVIVVVENDSKMNLGCVAEVCLAIRSGLGTSIKEIRKKIVLSEHETKLSFEFEAQYSGINEICIEKVMVYSAFSLMRRSFSSEQILSFMIMPEYKEFSIYPEIVSEEREGESERFSRLKPGSDPSELFEIRTYRPGDKLNRINWKFTAKNKEMMVQDYGFPVACDTGIFLDVSKEKDANKIETVIEMLYFLVVRMVLEKRIFYVVWKDAEEGCVIRQMVREEEDIFTLFSDLFSTNQGASKMELEDMYLGQYEGEFLAETIFLTTGRKDLEEEALREKLHTNHIELLKV